MNGYRQSIELPFLYKMEGVEGRDTWFRISEYVCKGFAPAEVGLTNSVVAILACLCGLIHGQPFYRGKLPMVLILKGVWQSKPLRRFYRTVSHSLQIYHPAPSPHHDFYRVPVLMVG